MTDPVSTTKPPPLPFSRDAFLGGLYQSEYIWRYHSKWLAEKGYMLRRRYQEDWEPSWFKSKEDYDDCEDGMIPPHMTIMDAVRISDGRIVTLKRTNKLDNPHEESIHRLFSHKSLASDPQNHCVPLYEVLQSPLDKNTSFLVMPFLLSLKDVKFATVGEVIECIRQLCEGLQFIHSCRVAHCDVKISNVMMGPDTFSDIPHPANHRKTYDFKRRVKKYTRTSRPTKYYYIDFGLSMKFAPGQPMSVYLPIGGDKSVPEFKYPTKLFNPFFADIYTLGNLIRMEFLQASSSVNFLKPLVDDMTREEPRERPTIDQVVERFNDLCAHLCPLRLRLRFVYRDEFFIASLYRHIRHLFRTTYYVASGLPALPRP